MMKTRIIILFALLVAVNGIALGQTKKKVSFLGDSYTTYKGWVYPETNVLWYTGSNTDTNVHDVKYTWWYILLEEMGYEMERNNSYSGSTICHTGYNKEDYSAFSFVTRVDDNNLGSPDIIYIFGATNDRYAGSPLGDYQYSDWTKDDLYKFRPAMAYMLDKLKNKQHPNAEIYFILSPYLTNEIDTDIYEICKYYGVDVITLKKDFNRKMGGHPTIIGMQEIADEVIAYMKSKETSISPVVVTENASNVYYNLAGQRVAQPTKGLYIVNGKKVILK